MCGISAVVGDRAVLRASQISSNQSYRGTSSTGVAWPVAGHIEILKNLLPPKAFFDKHKDDFKAIQVHTALGHNRLPSVGEVSRNNAHPFMACTGDFALVHNGTGTIPTKWIKSLADRGHTFIGETDSEVMTHAIEELLVLAKNYPEAGVPVWVKALRGFYKNFNPIEGFAILCMTKEGEIWGIRNTYPIKIAQYNGEVFVASCTDGLEELDGKKVKAFEPHKGTVFNIANDGSVKFWGTYDKEEAILHASHSVYTEFTGYNFYNSEGWQNWSERQKIPMPLVQHSEQQIDALMEEWMQANNKGKLPAHIKKNKYKMKPGKHSVEELWQNEKQDTLMEEYDGANDIDEGAGYVYHWNETTSHFDRMRKCNLCHKAYRPQFGHYCKGGWENPPRQGLHGEVTGEVTYKGVPVGTMCQADSHTSCTFIGCGCPCHKALPDLSGIDLEDKHSSDVDETAAEQEAEDRDGVRD
jgi:hypothetical protein